MGNRSEVRFSALPFAQWYEVLVNPRCGACGVDAGEALVLLYQPKHLVWDALCIDCGAETVEAASAFLSLLEHGSVVRVKKAD